METLEQVVRETMELWGERSPEYSSLISLLPESHWQPRIVRFLNAVVHRYADRYSLRQLKQLLTLSKPEYQEWREHERIRLALNINKWQFQLSAFDVLEFLREPCARHDLDPEQLLNLCFPIIPMEDLKEYASSIRRRTGGLSFESEFDYYAPHEISRGPDSIPWTQTESDVIAPLLSREGFVSLQDLAETLCERAIDCAKGIAEDRRFGVVFPYFFLLDERDRPEDADSGRGVQERIPAGADTCRPPMAPGESPTFDLRVRTHPWRWSPERNRLRLLEGDFLPGELMGPECKRPLWKWGETQDFVCEIDPANPSLALWRSGEHVLVKNVGWDAVVELPARQS